MPPFDVLEQQALSLVKTKTLIYGAAKTKKTWWAARIAELGFNVHFFAAEEGTQIIRMLPNDIRKTINIIDLRDRPDMSVASIFLALVAKQKPFCWDDVDRIQRTTQGGCDPTHGHYWIDTSKLTTRDVIVVDTWTMVSASILLQAAMDKGIDLSDASRPEQDIYNYMWNFAVWLLKNICSLNCHIVVVSHQESFDKYRPKKNPKDKNEPQILQFSRIQPVAHTRNFGMRMAASFDNVLYFYLIGDNVRVSTEANSDRDAGSRVIGPGTFSWDDLQFKHICEANKIKVPFERQPSEAIKYYAPGEVVADFHGTEKQARSAPGPLAVAGSPITIDSNPAAAKKISFADRLKAQRENGGK
jgi:hypothetical protein